LKLFSRIPPFLKNKYLLAGGFFVVWMFLFDPKDIHTDFTQNTKLQELQKNEQHFNQLITDTKKELEQLKTNAQTIEKYAREKYMMKKDNEDLFIVQADKISR
jgi:cell division protein DivIC